MTWFPSNNTLSDKATYDFSSPCPKALTVVSNGGSVGRRARRTTRTWHWREHDRWRPTSSSVSIGQYDVLTGDTAERRAAPLLLRPEVGGAPVARQVPTVLRTGSRSSARIRSSSAGVIVDNVAVRLRARGADPAGVPRPPGHEHAGPRARPPVVRRLGHARGLERHLAQRGLRHLRRVAVGGAARTRAHRRATSSSLRRQRPGSPFWDIPVARARRPGQPVRRTRSTPEARWPCRPSG